MSDQKYSTPHPLSGQTVTVSTEAKLFGQAETTLNYRVEDWWIRATGKSWMYSDGNPAAMGYGIRSGLAGLPINDDVVYGHTPDGLGHLVHISEIQAVAQ